MTDGDGITSNLLALRGALVREHPDSLFEAWQEIRQARHKSVTKGQERILAAVDDLLASAYESTDQRVAV